MLLIKNGALVNAGEEPTVTDVLIKEQKVEKIGKDLEKGLSAEELKNLEIIEAKGLHVLPGLVDAHCHLRDPGFEYKEDIASGTKSAVQGGFTSVACMPNTSPVVDNKTIVRYIVDKAKAEGACHVYPIGSITKGLEGAELAEMGNMKEAGIVAVSDDGKPVKNPSIMKKAMIYASEFGLRVISHCEDLDLAEGGSMNEGEISGRLGLRGIPSASEDLMVSREVILAEYTGFPVHIAHVSTKASVEILRQAKKRKVPVTAETCPHYFSLTEDACADYDTNAKMNPPLRGEEDRLAVIEGLKDGTLDIIATDHAPHHRDEKLVEFENAPNGIVGFETAFSLSVTYLVETGVLTISQLVEKLASKPAEILGIGSRTLKGQASEGRGALKEGGPADVTLADLSKTWTVDVNRFASKSKNSPFNGMELKGQILYTLVDGKVVYKAMA